MQIFRDKENKHTVHRLEHIDLCFGDGSVHRRPHVGILASHDLGATVEVVLAQVRTPYIHHWHM